MSEEYKVSIPLLSKEEIKVIEQNWNELTDTFLKMHIEEKEQVIAQYVMKKQKEEIEQKDKEIDRLLDIIDKLENHLYNEWLEWKDTDCESIYVRAFEDKAIYDYLQELKESNKE